MWQSPLEALILSHPTGNLRDSVGHNQSDLTGSERGGAFLTLHRRSSGHPWRDVNSNLPGTQASGCQQPAGSPQTKRKMLPFRGEKKGT